MLPVADRDGGILDDSPLTPELREFIDQGIVPILVKLYLEELKAENNLANEPRVATHSASKEGL